LYLTLCAHYINKAALNDAILTEKKYLPQNIDNIDINNNEKLPDIRGVTIYLPSGSKARGFFSGVVFW
jgi:hypothetical protein